MGKRWWRKRREKNRKNSSTKKRTAITTEINFSAMSIKRDHKRLSERLFLSLRKIAAHIQEQMANVLFVNEH